MPNLRIKRIKATSNTSIRVEFSEALDSLINSSNIEIFPVLSTLPTPQIIDVNIDGNLINIKTQPLTPFVLYDVIFKSSSNVRFISLNGDSYIFENGSENVASFQAMSEPDSPIKAKLKDNLKDNIYNLEDNNLVGSLINAQDKTLSDALHDIGQTANDNYLEVLVSNERKIRGAGAFDRLNQEGSFEVVRVGLTEEGFNNSMSLSFDSFPRDVITLQSESIVEDLVIGNGPGTFDKLTLTTTKAPVTKLNSVIIRYQDGTEESYNIDAFGYRINNPIYDLARAFRLFTLGDNQFKLSDKAFVEETSDNPGLGNFSYTDNQYVFTENLQPESVFISEINQKIYMLGTAGTPALYQYSFDYNSNGIVDLSSITYDGIFTTLPIESKCFRFSPDGMFLITISAYTLSPGANIIRTYQLSSPFDIDSKIQISAYDLNVDLALGTTNILLTANARGFEFSDDGTRIWIIGNLSTNPQTYPQHLYEYSLSTPYDIGTMTLVRLINIASIFNSIGIPSSHSGILDPQEIRWINPYQFIIVFATSTNKFAMVNLTNPYDLSDLSTVSTNGTFFNPALSSFRGFDFIRRPGYSDRLYTLARNTQTLREATVNIFRAPVAGDIISINYDYKSLGRQINPESVTVTEVIKVIREVAPPITTEFSLKHAPVVTELDNIPTFGGVEFLNPRACEPFSESHPAFTREIPYRLGGLPAASGEYCIDYETGRVFVFGTDDFVGTGPFPPAINYNYRKYYDNKLDYSYNQETADLAASPLRDLVGQSAKISFNYEQTLIPNVDFIAKTHIESLNERVENKLATATSLYTNHSPITNVFRVINETTGEIYPVNRFNDTTIFFSANIPPSIRNVQRERVTFTDVLSETLVLNEELTNSSLSRIFKINLANNRIISGTEDSIGSVFDSSVSFSRNDIFAKELYFDGQILSVQDNINKLETGEYAIDYENGVIYVAVYNFQNLDLGTVNYKKPTITTSNKHIISVSKIYHNINPNSNVFIDIDYRSFNNTTISPIEFSRSDERFLNNDTTFPYIYDNGTILVSNNIKNIRGIYDVYDLNNNKDPINFSDGAIFSANVITANPNGINQIREYNIGTANTISVPFISPGIAILEVNSVIRRSDGVELWDNAGTISGYDIILSGINSPVDGDAVIVDYNLTMTGGSTPVINYNRGDYYVDYSYLADEILVSYEYGDNVIDFRESNAINEGREYFVTYKVGALRDALFANFGTLVDLPIISSFDTSFDREKYRDALQGALQSFTKGPTIPAMKLLISSVTKADPEIIESVFDTWSLGISSLFNNQPDIFGEPELSAGKFDNGLFINQEGQSVTLPMSSNLRLEDGNLNFHITPKWDGIDNDATLTFSNLIRDGYEIDASSIFIGSDSHHPIIVNGEFSVNRLDLASPIGLPSAVFTNVGVFIYYDLDEKVWKILAKDEIGGLHSFSGVIKTSGEFYDVKFIEGLGEDTDYLASITDQIDFTFNIDNEDTANPDGYSDSDGYMFGNSFDGISFMSDDKHYIIDFGESKAKNRFSIYKDGTGFINFEVFDNINNSYKVSYDISDWRSGDEHFVSASWKIGSFERKDEIHLFVDGLEVPNILRFGGRPLVTTGDRWREVKPEIVVGSITRPILRGQDLTTVIGSNVAVSENKNFTTENILVGDTINILEEGFGLFTITGVSGNVLTLNSPVPASLTDARYSVNTFTSIVPDEMYLFSNIAVSILSGGVETELPGKRAEFPAYTLDKNYQLQTVLTLYGPARIGDQILIRTFGINHRRCKENVYLWSNTQNILKTQLPPPISLDDVVVRPIILALTSIGPDNSIINAGNFEATGITTTEVSNSTEGRILEIRVTGDNVDFSNPVIVTINGTSDGGPTEVINFTDTESLLTSNKWQTITDIEVIVTPFTTSADSTAIEIKEAYSITYSDGNNTFPIIRYSYKNNSGANLSGVGDSIVSGGYFLDTDIGNYIIITAPISVAGTYLITDRIDNSNVVVSPTPPMAFTGGTYEVYNTTIGRSGFQNGYFTFELAGGVGVPYPLPMGLYEFDYPAYLQINFNNINDQIIHIGSDFNKLNPAKAVIDELTVFSNQLTDVRVGEESPPGGKSVTSLFTALKEFIPDSETLIYLPFNKFPILNYAPFYKIKTKEYLQSSNSVNDTFGHSLVITERPFVVNNDGKLSTFSEGTIDMFVSPKFDTYNDPNERYYFDASSNVTEETISLTSTTLRLEGLTNNVLSVRLTTDTDNTGINFFENGKIANDSQTLVLSRALPSQRTSVKVEYIPNGFNDNRISIYKDSFGFLVFNVRVGEIDYQVRRSIFWQRNTWHKIRVTYKFNRQDNQDELRLFIDGRESGVIMFGQGLLFGQGIVFGQGSIGDSGSAPLIANIDFTDTINRFYIGSTYNKTKLAAARFDNIKISNKAIPPLVCNGMYVDESYQTNIEVIRPLIEDLYTTYLMNFDHIFQKNKEFAVLRDEKYGIFNFIINIIDSFDIISEDIKINQVLMELINALKPAQSKATINVVK
jgi:hypothetical protein